MKFKVPITVNGTNYFEEVEIDEKNELEYFHVPAHNQVAEADYVYDFKNVSVKAVVCFPPTIIRSFIRSFIYSLILIFQLIAIISCLPFLADPKKYGEI